MAEQVWWIVTLREEGDDEDALYIVEADNEDAAVEAAQESLAHDNGYDEDENEWPTLYVNHIVRCVGEKPTHVRSAPV